MIVMARFRAALVLTALVGALTPGAGLSQTVVPQTASDLQLSFSPIVKRAAPAVVNVYATEKREEVRSPFSGDPFFERFFGGAPRGRGQPRERALSSLGSGVIVDPDGVVVTNDHVIRDATEVKVALEDGREFQAEILLRDERTDLAVLKLQGAEAAFPALEFADSDELEVGDLVLAIGNPFGVGQTVTSGIVSAVARTQVGISDSAFFVQTDAAINPGNSGGALVNMDGAIAGINTAIYSRSGGSIGIGFAIPSNMVRTVVAQALAGSTSVERPWIGIQGQRVTPDIAASMGLPAPTGALITRVDPDSPADKAGLKVGDLVLQVAGREIRALAALDYRLAIAGIGKPTDLLIMRGGKTLTVSVVAAKEPDIQDLGVMVLEGRSPLTGAAVANLSSTVASRLQLRDVANGVAIVAVDPRSPAARFGFRPGDVVQRIQGEDVEDAEQLQKITEEQNRLWRVTINRRGRVANLMIGG